MRFTGETGEAHNAICLSPNEPQQDLHGGVFRFDEIDLKGAQTLIATPSNQPLVTINKIGRGKVVFVGVRDLLGEDERLPAFVAHLLVHLAADVTPVKVEGDVEYLINRNAGGWVVILFNDNGVFKPQQGLAQVNRSAIAKVNLSLRSGKISTATEWTSDQTLSIRNESVSITIPAGGIAVVELTTQR